MIDTKELRRLVQAAISKMNARDPEFASSVTPLAVLELLDRLEAAESECLEQARLNGMGSEREAALMAKLEAAEKDIAVKEEVIDSLAAVVKRLNAQCDAAEKEREMDEERIADLMADLNRVGHEIDALRAKITEMEKQEPFDADSDVFRGAFEAALKAGNWPATRQGDGYRSPSTQIAWRIAFSTVNRLKLYALPDAQTQPAPSVPDGWLRAIDEALVTAHIGVANAHDTYEQAKAKLDSLIGFRVDVATDPAVNGGWKLVPIEPTR